MGRNLQISPDEIINRWCLPQDTADELSILLLAQTEGQVPQMIVVGTMEQHRFAAAANRLFDKGLLAWKTSNGWAFDREPFSPASGRRCSGIICVSREGAMAALPYAADLWPEEFQSDGESVKPGPDPEWLLRSILEHTLMPRIAGGPAAPSGRSGDLYGDAPSEMPQRAIGELLHSDPASFPASRPVKIDAASIVPNIHLETWAMFERSSVSSTAHVEIAGIDANGALSINACCLTEFDPVSRKAKSAYGEGWISLGDYDADAVVAMLKRPFREGGMARTRGSFRIIGDTGRPMTEEEALSCTYVPGTGIDVLLEEARAIRDDRLAELAGPAP